MRKSVDLTIIHRVKFHTLRKQKWHNLNRTRNAFMTAQKILFVYEMRWRIARKSNIHNRNVQQQVLVLKCWSMKIMIRTQHCTWLWFSKANIERHVSDIEQYFTWITDYGYWQKWSFEISHNIITTVYHMKQTSPISTFSAFLWTSWWDRCSHGKNSRKNSSIRSLCCCFPTIIYEIIQSCFSNWIRIIENKTKISISLFRQFQRS